MYGMFKMNTRFIQPGRVNKGVSEAEKKEAETNNFIFIPPVISQLSIATP